MQFARSHTEHAYEQVLLHVEYGDSDTALEGDALMWSTPLLPSGADFTVGPGVINLDLFGYRVSRPTTANTTLPVFAGIVENVGRIDGNPRNVPEIVQQVRAPFNLICYGRAWARCNMKTVGVIRAGIPLVLDDPTGPDKGKLTEMVAGDEHLVVAWFMDQSVGAIDDLFRVFVKGM